MDFDIINNPFSDSNVSHAVSPAVYISRCIRLAWASGQAND